jgi:hypothetical protein
MGQGVITAALLVMLALWLLWRGFVALVLHVIGLRTGGHPRRPALPHAKARR